MKVKILKGKRGPIGSIQEVYLKVQSRHGTIWYVIPATVGYHIDSSTISSSDNIFYRHPDATGRNGFITGECIPVEYTYIEGKDCEEVVEASNNKEARRLLSKEW